MTQHARTIRQASRLSAKADVLTAGITAWPATRDMYRCNA